MFKGIYDKFLQSLTTSWAVFLEKNGDTGRLFREEFTHQMYLIAGILLIAISLLSCLIYYRYLNMRFGSYYKLPKYLVTMLINALLVGVLTGFAGWLLFKKFICPIGAHITMIGLINFLYAFLLFFLFSLLLKWNSPMGKRTPF